MCGVEDGTMRKSPWQVGIANDYVAKAFAR
jgi:hypothetical protein